MTPEYQDHVRATRAKFFPHIPTRIARPSAPKPKPIPAAEPQIVLTAGLPPAITYRARDLLRLVAQTADVSLLDLASERRAIPIVRPRQIFCWLAKRYTKQSLPQIGSYIGSRDHTTVLHALRRVQTVVDLYGPADADTPQAWIGLLLHAEWPAYNRHKRPRGRRGQSLESRVRWVLGAYPGGLSSVRVLTLIESDGGRAVTMTQVCAALSRMKSDGVTEMRATGRRGHLWALVDRRSA